MVKLYNQGGFQNNNPLRKSVSTKGKRVTLFSCPHCDVTSSSSPGMKGHITKKHRDIQKTKKDLIILREENAKQKEKEVSDVVEHLLSEVIVLSDDEESLKTIESREKEVDTILDLDEDIKELKEYCNACDEWDYRITANRKYVALQELRKHKDEKHVLNVITELKHCKI